MSSTEQTLASIPPRAGAQPETTAMNPHQQLSQKAPQELQEAVFQRASALPGVTVAPSRVSVPGTRAFWLDPSVAKGPPEAFMIGREFAHIHPAYDGSLHLMLPLPLAALVIDRGWGELHPVARMGLIPATAVMIFGPRDAAEVDVVWQIVQFSHAFACGQLIEA
jgi:hypothetical protein